LVKELPPSVSYVSNPAMISVSNLNMLVTSTDAVTSINTNILFKQGDGCLPRVDACLDQLLRARSLFPVMPSTVRIEPSQRFRLDISETKFPHIVVTPSLAGRGFIKKISDCVFVNPGFMSDATYSNSKIAELIVQPGTGNVLERVNGDLVKWQHE